MKKRPVKAKKDPYKLLIESRYPAYIIDAETFAFIEVNNIACELYGYTPAEFRLRTVLDLHPKENRGKVNADRSLLGHFKVYYANWTHKKKNGELIPVKVTADKIVFQNRDSWFVVIKPVPSEK